MIMKIPIGMIGENQPPLCAKDLQVVYDSIHPALADSYVVVVMQVQSHLGEKVVSVQSVSNTADNNGIVEILHLWQMRS